MIKSLTAGERPGYQSSKHQNGVIHRESFLKASGRMNAQHCEP